MRSPASFWDLTSNLLKFGGQIIYLHKAGISVIRVKCSVWCFVPWKEDEKGLNHSHFDLNLDEWFFACDGELNGFSRYCWLMSMRHC